ncbi:MAG: disulfide bond formation protein B [Alphaproteobacteria bacterium]|nr:disulfide bond formation protein B [Alphaproteobacteria bacterium]
MAQPRHAPLLILLASLAVLGGAFAFQYIGGLDPCILCIYQRFPYGATIGLGAIALVLAHRGRRGALPWLLGLSAIAFAVGGGIAAYHVGVEQHWWRGTAACGASGAVATTIEELRRQIMNAPIVRCDEVPWSLFGVSMAGYTVLMSAALATFSLWAARGLARPEAAPGRAS